MADSFTQNPRELEQFLGFLEEDIESVKQVKDFCQEKGLDVEFEVHPKAETCEESAQHSDIEIGQIVKTLIFKAGEEFIAVLAPGDKRADTEKVKDISNKEEIRMATPQEVKEKTDYVVGGVSPFNLDMPLYMEEGLLEYEIIRPAAGSRVIGIEISPTELEEAVGAETAEVIED